jgi:D-alanyl-D-alanine carboxypeptidase/D-alanyl-D-alanine-endopeptidase (penicillin-binding protein 4)
LIGSAAGAQEPEEPQPESRPAAAIPAAPAPAPPADRAQRDRWLVARIDALVAARPELGPARVGIAVDDVATGRALYRKDGDAPFNVASNVKVVTAAAALSVLGPEYRFKTSFLADTLDTSGTVTGNLYLRATGDPGLDAAALWQMVQELRLVGVKKVTGALVIDDAFFDGATMPPDYEQKPEDAAFRAPVGAASVDYNAVTVWVQPGPAAGAPARVATWPAQDYVVVKSTVTTVASGRTALAATAKALPAGTEITVAGQIRADDLGGENLRKRIDHPTFYVAATVRALLAQAGIRVGKDFRVAAAPRSARALVTHVSDPVAVLVREMSKYSNNFMAETLLKTMGAEDGGAPGTWAKGVAAVTAWLAATAGLEKGSYRYENGSGLYDSNRFTPAQIVRVLRVAAMDFRYGPEYMSAMAIAGADGTLARRMVGGAAERYVRAKSGTLKSVSCLSGFAGGAGRPLAFAVLANDVPETAAAIRAVRSLEDQVAELLVRYVEAGD